MINFFMMSSWFEVAEAKPPTRRKVPVYPVLHCCGATPDSLANAGRRPAEAELLPTLALPVAKNSRSWEPAAPTVVESNRFSTQLSKEYPMKTIALGAFAVTLLASAASAAPLNATVVGSPEASNIDQVRLVCNEYGRCWRTRGPRYVQRYYGDDDSYVVRRSYGYYGGPGYYDRGYGYYGGPSIGFSFGTRGW
jgi:hypothetical protein